MCQIPNSYIEKKTAITFLSGSAGELDWVLPILDYLSKKNFNISIVFLTRHARASVEKNSMLKNYISQKNIQPEVHLCGGYLAEKIERLGYLAHRAAIKLKLQNKPAIKFFHSLLNKIFKKIFFLGLPLNILNLQEQKCLFFSEYPSLRRPRDQWLKEKFHNSLFFYCPHSPHIYAKDLGIQYQDVQVKNINSRSFLLLGHPADYLVLNDGGELSDPDLEKVFIGHPKYSNSWLHDRREESKKFRISLSTRNKINILVLSRGSGSYLNKDYHTELADSVVGTINEQIESYNLFIKKHPREEDVYWDSLVDKYSSISIIDNHIYDIVSSVDFVISFWSSGAMDCHAMGVPVIELFDPNRYSKQQFLDGENYTTIYRKLGVVFHANNKKDLEEVIENLIKNNFNVKLGKPHPLYSDLIERSNDWQITLDKILSVNSF